MPKEAAQAPEAKLIFTHCVKTDLGTRDVRLYWGDVASVPNENAVVIVSTTAHSPFPTGQAWRAMQAGFSELKGSEDKFQSVLTLCPNSAVWPMSEPLAGDWARLVGLPTFFPPAVLVGPRVNEKRLRRVFVLRMLPKHQANPADYRHALRACFVGLCAQESLDLCTEDEGGVEPSGPYRQVVMSALAATQGYDLGQILRNLIDEACVWLKASPRWESVDIAYWREGIDEGAKLVPQSLYDDQLAKRLAREAR